MFWNLNFRMCFRCAINGQSRRKVEWTIGLIWKFPDLVYISVIKNKNARSYTSSPPQSNFIKFSAVYPHMTHPCAICAHPATQKCGACKRVFYCSKEHQELVFNSGHVFHHADPRHGKSTKIFAKSI